MKHKLTLTFVLNEPSMPQFFAERVLAACYNNYTLRVDEGIEHPQTPGFYMPITVDGKLITKKIGD